MVIWGASISYLTDYIHKDIGSGKTNTYYMTSEEYGTTTVATLCTNYCITNGGVVYDDWFLPSNDEMQQIVHQLIRSNVGAFLEYTEYWTSSQYSFDESIFLNNSDFYGYWGYFDYHPRLSTGKVRPVWAF